jgi:DNA-binding protein HU-beta/integration host factor subunit alpha
MTKRDLVIRISEETGLVQQQVQDLLQKTLDAISSTLAKGEKVELRNFGIFEIRIRKARTGRNPNHPGTDVPIPERAVVRFKAGKEMREAVCKLDPTKVVISSATDKSDDDADDAEPESPAASASPGA